VKLEEKREIVIVASLGGYLRVYEPHQQTSDSSNDSDLPLDTMLPDPILGIESRRFNNYGHHSKKFARSITRDILL